jgi:hypothetical protein
MTPPPNSLNCFDWTRLFPQEDAMKEKDCGTVSATGYRTVFAHADEIHRRVVINGTKAMRVSKSLRLPRTHVWAFARLLREWGRVPPKSRLAVAAMLVPDASDEDIAWAFGMPLKWAQSCRSHRHQIRKAWPVDARMERAVELEEEDPTPAQIAEMCAAMPRVLAGEPYARRAPGIRAFRFDSHATLVPQFPE